MGMNECSFSRRRGVKCRDRFNSLEDADLANWISGPGVTRTAQPPDRTSSLRGRSSLRALDWSLPQKRVH
jgi:hypothetical protein